MAKKISKNIEIANEIIKEMESNNSIWEKGWDFIKTGQCINASTNKPYRGLNFIVLLSKIKKNKYKDGRFLTYAQCKQLGGNVKPGAKATTLVHYAEYDKLTKKLFNSQTLIDQGKTPVEITKYKNKNVYTYMKPFWVFNISQCENLKLPELKKLSPEEINKRTNKVLEEIIKNSPVKIYNDGLDSAYYNPETDTIHLPEKGSFKSLDDYYSTILHELAHAVGHKERLNRNLSGEFGSKEYSEEECIAEFTAIMLQNQAGINLKGKHLKNPASYIKNWLSKSKPAEKPFDLVRIISQADKSCSFIMEKCLSKKFLKDLEVSQQHSKPIQQLSK